MLVMTPLMFLLVTPFIPQETLHRLTLIVSDPASARVEHGLRAPWIRKRHEPSCKNEPSI